MDIKKILHEISQNEQEKFRFFKEMLIDYCSNKKNAVISIFRDLRHYEIELGEYLSGRFHIIVDRSITLKVLKTIRIELEIIRYRMRHPGISMEEMAKPLKTSFNLKWTGNNVDFVELIYALQAIGYINDGKITLKELFDTMGEILNFEVKDYSRTFRDVRNRGDRTKLLDEMKQVMLQKMDKFDERT